MSEDDKRKALVAIGSLAITGIIFMIICKIVRK